jgi:hypothetical protein
MHRKRLYNPQRASTALSSAHELQRLGMNGKGQSQVGYFPRVGNDAIQPLEKSASNRLICNDQNFGTCGLQDFDAGEGERRRGGRERNKVLNDQSGVEVKSASSRRNPRKHAGSRKEKVQPRVVDLYELVEGTGIESESASVVILRLRGYVRRAPSQMHSTLCEALCTQCDKKPSPQTGKRALF